LVAVRRRHRLSYGRQSEGWSYRGGGGGGAHDEGARYQNNDVVGRVASNLSSDNPIFSKFCRSRQLKSVELQSRPL
jgi:hypothetical protein